MWFGEGIAGLLSGEPMAGVPNHLFPQYLQKNQSLACILTINRIYYMRDYDERLSDGFCPLGDASLFLYTLLITKLAAEIVHEIYVIRQKFPKQ